MGVSGTLLFALDGVTLPRRSHPPRPSLAHLVFASDPPLLYGGSGDGVFCFSYVWKFLGVGVFCSPASVLFYSLFLGGEFLRLFQPFSPLFPPMSSLLAVRVLGRDTKVVAGWASGECIGWDLLE